MVKDGLLKLKQTAVVIIKTMGVVEYPSQYKYKLNVNAIKVSFL
jgi:hypothetical protein